MKKALNIQFPRKESDSSGKIKLFFFEGYQISCVMGDVDMMQTFLKAVVLLSVISVCVGGLFRHHGIESFSLRYQSLTKEFASFSHCFKELVMRDCFQAWKHALWATNQRVDGTWDLNFLVGLLAGKFPIFQMVDKIYELRRNRKRPIHLLNRLFWRGVMDSLERLKGGVFIISQHRVDFGIIVATEFNQDVFAPSGANLRSTKAFAVNSRINSSALLKSACFSYF